MLWTLAQGAERAGSGRVYPQNLNQIAIDMKDEAVGCIQQLKQF